MEEVRKILLSVWIYIIILVIMFLYSIVVLLLDFMLMMQIF